MPTLLRPLTVIAAVLLVPAVRADVSPEELRPGLVTTFADQAGTRIVRLEPAVALNLAAGEAAHPRLSAEGGTVRWEGSLNLVLSGEYRFSARLRGKLRVTVAGRDVLSADGTDEAPAAREGATVRLEAGVVPVVAEFTRLPGSARVELFWQGPSFRREPLAFDAC